VAAACFRVFLARHLRMVLRPWRRGTYWSDTRMRTHREITQCIFGTCWSVARPDGLAGTATCSEAHQIKIRTQNDLLFNRPKLREQRREAGDLQESLDSSDRYRAGVRRSGASALACTSARRGAYGSRSRTHVGNVFLVDKAARDSVHEFDTVGEPLIKF
jgi:hypothetical protein